MDTSLTVSVISLVVAFASAVIAYLSVREQRRLTTNVTSFTQIAALEMLLEKNPQLLLLHNVDPKALEADGIEMVELVYLAQSFAAADFYHRLAGERPVVLTEYRRNMLKNAKVQRVWEHYIRGRFISAGPYTEAVDMYIREMQITRGTA